jgi:branched-chain amino acid transport system ATP-binding protein
MLVLQDIAVTYHNIVPAVQGVSIEVPDKKVVALLGANGAGKTTIMRAISGLLNIHRASLVQGSILFDGERIDRLNATQIVHRGIAQVLEGRRLFADLTIEENLRTGASASRNSTATTQQNFERVIVPLCRRRVGRSPQRRTGGEPERQRRLSAASTGLHKELLYLHSILGISY